MRPESFPALRLLTFLSPLHIRPSFNTVSLLLQSTAMLSPGLSVRLPKRAFPAFRAQRQFSSARPTCKEIQEAYILSASRTPTAKVSFLEESCGNMILTFG
jgi:hypothetical protein